ncbi:nucleoside deaminase [Blastopirellula marina]|uniref:Nucleoside deaminase n=1 Tax=Blastopirellula marina TaxID=124 RepID=A0A2S8FD63_9BACT|nr:nucleoside deaminase [Blastopirellula marina]PQO30096.1 nucleoside deaminase [Blastopirellula marina]PQO43155.1 nucleoside deaminase [Blastopirellula marina]PTL42534.1 nucleoside deaminase [Blastopirellula marina]
MISPSELMQLAIDKAKEGIAAGQSPFGCAIALDGEVIAVSHNIVLQTTDVTAHAEVTALRVACQKVGEILLPQAIVATTCEPCPMCAAALHWARVAEVHYGATIDDAAETGFNELRVPARSLYEQGGSSTRLFSDVERAACRELFELWKSGDAPIYY